MSTEAKSPKNKEDSVKDGNIVDGVFFEKKLKEKDAKIKNLDAEVKSLKDKIHWFEEQIKLGRARKYGKSSEQSEVIQFDFFHDEIEEQETKPEQAETISCQRKKKSTGRKIDTANLPREIVIHDLKDEEKSCADCQGDLHKIGEDVSEKIEIVPAVIKVIEHRRAKYGCRTCDTMKSAPKFFSLIPKSMAGNSLIVEVILAKYQRHIPLYRQSQIFKSAKIDIPYNTLGNWVLSAFEALAPINDALWEQLDHTHVLQADETPVKMLSEDKKGYMWVYHSCDLENRFVLFEYNTSRSARVVNNRLHNFNGILQSDGYSGYNDQRARKGVVNVGCFAHCRRKFADVVKASSSKAGRAHIAVNTIGKLYKIERDAKEMSHKERYQLRQERAKPILDKFYAWLKEALPKTLPKSNIGKAISYAINQWRYLSEYVNHGEVEIDNNLVENKIRPFALGRKNWMFVGNKRGADAAAMFYSLIETCKLNDIEPRSYLMKLFELAPKVRRGELNAKDVLPQALKSSL